MNNINSPDILQDIGGLKADAARDKNQLMELFSQLKELRRYISKLATISDVEKIVKKHQDWEEKTHQFCTMDREQLNRRIKSLEKWKWFITGGSAVIGFLANKFSRLL